MKRTFLLLPVLGALLLAGCSSGPAASQDPAAALPEPSIPASPPPAPAEPAAVHLPLDTFVRTASGDQGTLDKAGALLTTKCMRAKGFDYTPQATGTGSASAAAPLPGYGINDPTEAKKTGYTPAGNETLADLAAAGKVPTPRDLVAKNGEAWVKALYGFVPPDKSGNGGCANESIVHVPEYDKLDRELPGRLSGSASERTKGDSRVVAALTGWSACMAESGYQYKSPAEPLRQKWPAPRASAEIATAVADVNCKQRTNLPGIWFAVETGYQQALLDQNAPALKQLADAWKLVLEKAEQVVSQGG